MDDAVHAVMASVFEMVRLLGWTTAGGTRLGGRSF
jgi:hypothetical protein